jgi:hypothetical protein
MVGLIAAWAATTGVVSYKWIHDEHQPPPPSALFATYLAYSLLGLLAIKAPGPAVAMAWALFIAALISGQLKLPATKTPAKAGAAA